MTPQARIKARFTEEAEAAGVRISVTARKSSATMFTEHVFEGRIFYMNIAGDYMDQVKFQKSSRLTLGMTSGGAFDATYSMEPKDIERVLAETQVNPDWLYANSSAAFRIAKGIREKGSFEELAVLADALEEAGCDSEHILRHCRAGAKHKGVCWVIEVLAAAGREKKA